jgi:hypothetical protein
MSGPGTTAVSDSIRRCAQHRAPARTRGRRSCSSTRSSRQEQLVRHQLVAPERIPWAPGIFSEYEVGRTVNPPILPPVFVATSQAD